MAKAQEKKTKDWGRLGGVENNTAQSFLLSGEVSSIDCSRL